MVKTKVSSEMVEFLKTRYGFTDEQIQNLSPTQWRHVNAHNVRENCRIIAEVVWEKNCAIKPKKGDKFVLNAGGILLPQESTIPIMCLWAIANFLPFVHIVYDRIAQGLDPSPVGWDSVKCSDVGVECGGMGEVLFKIYCEKASQIR